MENKRWLAGIDSIRFILAFIVLISHYTVPPLSPQHNVLNMLIKVFNHGFCGVAAVIAFFVISGLVIHYPNVGKTSIDVKRFVVRRFVRIGLPLAVLLIVAAYLKLADLIPIWSLYCELAYYALYPILFKIKLSWVWQFRVAFVAAMLFIFLGNFDSIASFIHQKNINYAFGYWSMGTFTTIVVGLPCWLLGVVLAERINTRRYEVKSSTLLLYRVAVLALSIMALVLRFHFYLSYMFSLNFLALFIVIWLEKEVMYYRMHKPSAVLEYCGKFSYSLYLVHQFTILALRFVFPSDTSTYFVYISGALMLAYIFYLLVEYPSHKLAQKLAAMV